MYLAPGLFGFARLAGFDYMKHVRVGLAERLTRAGRDVELHVADVHPSASIPRRVERLVDLVTRTAGGDGGPIHGVGHSTGGLDWRLAASPGVRLDGGGGPPPAWMERLVSLTSVNTPHFGTPLAADFATPGGQRFLYAVTALSLAALWLGAPPLSATAVLLAAMARARERSRIELGAVEAVTEALLRALDEPARREVQEWLRGVREDRGAIFQLTPESMDLFRATVGDRPGLRQQCVASFAPPSGVADWLAHVRAPWPVASAALFHGLHQATSRLHAGYSCAPERGADERLLRCLGHVPPATANDGIVPLRSQLWGEPVWVGEADHLDVVGHFGRSGSAGRSGGWLTCGAHFDEARFAELLDRVVEGMLSAEAERGFTDAAPGPARPPGGTA